MKKFTILAMLFLIFGACGSPRTTIRVQNRADGTATTISVKQGEGGSTSVDVHPSISSVVDSVQFSISGQPLR